MKRIIVLFATLTLFVLGAPQSFAQDSKVPMGPPMVLMLVREQLKTGKGAAHTAESHRFTLALRKAKSKWGRIGMVPVAGDENEVLYVWPFQSFADVEKMNQDIEAWSNGPLKADFDAIAQGPEDLHTAQHDAFAVYRPDLSYRPDINIAEMRYFIIETFHIRPGQEEQFNAAAKMYSDGMKKGNVDSHYVIYQMVAGVEGSVYLVIEPIKSLSFMDGTPARMKAFGEAVGMEGMKALDKMSGEMFQSTSSRIYAFNAQMSYVSPELAANDKSTPAFWNPN